MLVQGATGIEAWTKDVMVEDTFKRAVLKTYNCFLIQILPMFNPMYSMICISSGDWVD